MLKKLLHSFDHLYVAYVPFMIGALIVGMVCGAVFIGLAIASYFQLVNLGADFDEIGPVWLGLGGAGVVFGAYVGRWSVWDKRDKSLARIKKRATSDEQT